MKSNRSVPPSERFHAFDEDMLDRVRVMMAQEESPTYKCRDYLLRRKAEHLDESKSSKSDDVPNLVSEIDTLCREKMCEWAYRVVDHFHASRELVAIAFSYLDRFVDGCCCDRAAFKLAAMTCIYMATKVFNSREISMSSLAELSRGEFDMAHISEMERIILHTLDWRINGPTAQCYINYLHGMMPLPKGAVTQAIYQRATFFAELALFDYCFVTQPRSAIAMAALINAMEGMEGTVSKKQMDDYSMIVSEHLGLQHPKELIDQIRNRLWYVYSQSAQYHEDDVVPLPQKVPSEANVPVSKQHRTDGELSPKCVSVTVAGA